MRRLLPALAGTLTGTVVLAAAIVAPASLAAAQPAPEARTAQHGQVITVRTPSSGSTTGAVETWRWSQAQGRYQRVSGPTFAYVGSGGVGRASEYLSRTPAGIFTLTEAFGRMPDPGAHLKYRHVGRSSWWVSDVDSAKYNTFQRCSPGAWCGFDQSASEQLGAISVYSYAVVIDYNRSPAVPGRGSAFFLHVSGGAPTAGCVSLDSGSLVRILRWLRPAQHPVISIGVGDAAYRALR